MSDLAGRTIVITGSSSGLGRAAAVELARRGAELAVVGRNRDRTTAVAEQVGGTAFFADFDHLDQVAELADALLARFERIDVLANNAGGLIARRETTEDGFDRCLQANYLAPVLLTRLLLPRVAESGGRIISTASNSNMIGRLDLDDLGMARLPWRGGWQAYGTTKLETIMFIRELARRAAGVTAYSFHPGYVASNFGESIAIMRFADAISFGHLGLRPEQGAEPLVFLAGTDDVGAPSGAYFSRMTPERGVRRVSRNPELGRRLWERTDELLARWMGV